MTGSKQVMLTSRMHLHTGHVPLANPFPHPTPCDPPWLVRLLPPTHPVPPFTMALALPSCNLSTPPKLRYERERHDFRVEGAATAPGLRFGVHSAYSARLVSLEKESGALDRPGYDKKLSTELFVASARSVHEGTCHAFPRGALPGCEGLGVGEEMFRDLITWEKSRVSHWKKNRGAPQGSPSARDLYWAYYTRLWGLYGRLLQERGLSLPADVARDDTARGKAGPHAGPDAAAGSDGGVGDGGSSGDVGGAAPVSIDGLQQGEGEIAPIVAAEERRRDI